MTSERWTAVASGIALVDHVRRPAGFLVSGACRRAPRGRGGSAGAMRTRASTIAAPCAACQTVQTIGRVTAYSNLAVERVSVDAKVAQDRAERAGGRLLLVVSGDQRIPTVLS